VPLLISKGDITLVEADVIVNAANSEFVGGGGVDGAIHRAAGPSVMKELDAIRAKIGRCLTGKAVITGAGRLRAQYIVRAVGPVYRGGNFGEAEFLASCYRESIRLAGEHGAKSIAFPAISAGIYGYPMEEAARIAVREVRAGLEAPGTLETALFVLFSDAAVQTFERVNSIQ
jgi:O-acetyl-ADP-ribose deacetylase (regulator of RNase III)